ncbi:MAG TPA: glycosyltransferase [Dehalococcoidia bacterium]|nr:glycosyltransferase [Dehalococcoidia bacterium]
MRILYLADAPYPHTQRWVRHFAERGHECEVLSFRPAAIEGARVTHLSGLEALGKLRYLVKARGVARLVRERKPDLLHAMHLTSYGFLGALSGYHPFIASVWGMDVFEAPRLSPLHGWITRYALSHADAVTATGPALARATMRFMPPDCGVRSIPYGVDLDRFRPAEPLPREDVVVGTVSRLSPEKGLRHLIEAVASAGLRDQVKLRIAGEGPQRRRLEALVRERGLQGRVEFSGWLEYDNVPGFLRTLDIFVLPSLFEGFGVAAVEASACGLPVIASRVQGLPDVVVDGVTGSLVPPGDAGAIAEAIGQLARDPALRLRLGQAGREFVAEHYDWAKNAAEMARLYEELAGSLAGVTG